MEREYYTGIGSQDISHRGTKIYGLTAMFILSTVIPWLFTILFGVHEFFTSSILNITATIVIIIILITFATMIVANVRLPAIDWTLTFLLIVAVTFWSAGIIATLHLSEYIILFGCVVVAIILLNLFGSKCCTMDLLVVCTSFLLIWWFMALVLGVIFICLMFSAENRSMGIYLLAIIFYPFFFSFNILTGMFIRNGRYDTSVMPARNLYFNFVLTFLVTLLVWRVVQNDLQG
ncbi:uncharacterized protein [Musca autumnalis]|uniref:uncharacterized protein n=1 Tax=Musca autumnalis TaxID=221902 RepID=UPI003CF8E050